jgi:hypothetical protein
MHCRRQQILRKAASHGGIWNIDDDYEWVCTTGIADTIVVVVILTLAYLDHL